MACRFAGELGHHRAEPVTGPMFAQAGGAPREQASRLIELTSEVGFGERWLDLASGDVVAGGQTRTWLRSGK